MVKVRCKLCGEVKPVEEVKFFNGQSVCKTCILKKKYKGE